MEGKTSQDQPTTSTSAPKTQEEKPKSSRNKRKNSGKGKPPTNNNKAAKSETPEFQKKQDNAIILTYALFPYYELATSFTNVKYVTDCFYDILHSRDRKMTDLFSRDVLHYVVLMSIYNRCAKVSNAHGIFIPSTSDLKTLTNSILLPDQLAQYVETFGRVKTTNNCMIIPYFRGYSDMLDLPGFESPEKVARQIRPDDTLIYPWAISPQIITQYMSAVTRALKNALNMRKVTNDEIDGRAEFLSAFQHDSDGFVKCIAYDNIDMASCQLGASYRLHYKELTDHHGVSFPETHAAPAVLPRAQPTRFAGRPELAQTHGSC